MSNFDRSMHEVKGPQQSFACGFNHCREVAIKSKCKCKEPYRTGKPTRFRVYGDLGSRSCDQCLSGGMTPGFNWSYCFRYLPLRFICASLSMRIYESRGFWLIPPFKPSTCLHSWQHTCKFIACTELGNFGHCTEASRGVPCLL